MKSSPVPKMLSKAQKLGAKFLNPVPTGVGGLSLMLKILPLYITNRSESEPSQPLGPFHTDPTLYQTPPPSGLRVTWFGHSSTLLEIDGTRLLIDPVWDPRAAPTSFFGPKRFFPPTLSLAELPTPDVILISHDHYDHLGASTVRSLARLHPESRWVCPLKVGSILASMGVSASLITELDWTESTSIVTSTNGNGLTITALPARHFSGRSLTNRFETLWACYALASSKHKVFYGADSGQWEGFEEIARDFGPFDLSMLEIGAFHPLWSDIHMGPDGAAEVFRQMGGGVLMPIHWGLFNLALHAWRQPIERINQLAVEQNIKLFAPSPGIPTDFMIGTANNSEWWREA